MNKFLAALIILLLCPMTHAQQLCTKLPCEDEKQAKQICTDISCSEEKIDLESLKKELKPNPLFSGTIVNVNRNCISESAPRLEIDGGNIRIDDEDGIVAIGIFAQSRDENGKSIIIKQIMKYDGESFLNGHVSELHEGVASLRSLLEARLDKSGWPETANTELVFNMEQGLENGQIRNIHVAPMDSCGEVSFLKWD